VTPHRNTRWTAPFEAGLTIDVARGLYDPFQLRECWHAEPLRADQFCGTCEAR
jgi:hypothetical protein